MTNINLDTIETATTQAAPEISNEDVIKELQKDVTIQELVTKFQAKLKNIDFLIDEACVSRAVKGLDKPNIDERLDAQVRTNVRKEMRIEAAKVADAGGDYVVPSEEAIDAEVNKRINKRNKDVAQKKQSRLSNARESVRATLTNG